MCVPWERGCPGVALGLETVNWVGGSPGRVCSVRQKRWEGCLQMLDTQGPSCWVSTGIQVWLDPGAQCF